jgi:hypothetical protein
MIKKLKTLKEKIEGKAEVKVVAKAKETKKSKKK